MIRAATFHPAHHVIEPASGGPIETPVLAEQRDEYLIQQLKLYASGERRNDVYARMRLIASRLTEDEIKGLADTIERVFGRILGAPAVITNSSKRTARA